jgi:hypothetical protein
VQPWLAVVVKQVVLVAKLVRHANIATAVGALQCQHLFSLAQSKCLYYECAYPDGETAVDTVTLTH